MSSTPRSPGSALRRLSWTAAGWALGYGLYRSYYAAGGTLGILGTPVSWSRWLLINAVAGALLFAASVLPIALLKTWQHPRGRLLSLGVSWVIAVACASHALIGIVQRIASLTGALMIRYPFWQYIDRREADLQALFFNEPWFLIEGLLWAAIAWTGALRRSPHRLWWIGSAVAATGAATAIGLLSAFGVIGRVIVG